MFSIWNERPAQRLQEVQFQWVCRLGQTIIAILVGVYSRDEQLGLWGDFQMLGYEVAEGQRSVRAEEKRVEQIGCIVNN